MDKTSLYLMLFIPSPASWAGVNTSSPQIEGNEVSKKIRTI